MCGFDKPNEASGALNRIKTEYPGLNGPDWNVIDSRGVKTSPYGGGIEFYHPDESHSPSPGRPTVEVFNPKLQGPMLDRAIYGDMLHYMPEADPAFRQMREEYRQSMTPAQLDIDHRAYRAGTVQGTEHRSFPQWHDQSRLDAHVRGYLAPDEKNDWADAYTPVQRAIMDRMKTHLKGGQRSLP